MTSVILVVDDEPEVLHLIENFLRPRGFGIVTASEGEEAIRIFRESARRPDLVLTDVVMPGMSGPMLADRLLEIDPSVRVLFMSGFDDRQVVRKYVIERGYQLLPKPFHLKALMAAIETALNGAQS